MKRVAIAMSLMLCAAAAAAGEPPVGRASVIDGDTIEIHGLHVRLWGVDAPESTQTCQNAAGAAYRCGAAAANALATFIGVRTVECRPRNIDQYGRTVASCQVGGEDLGTWLVSAGWALAYERYSHDTYRAAQQQAASAHRGLHQGVFVAPWDYRHAQPARHPRPEPAPR